MSFKLYLAGPMSGYPAHNFPAFDAAADELRFAGFDVVSPADITRRFFRERGMTFDPETSTLTGKQLKALLADDIRALSTCDGIALLDGWENSKGANAEVEFARATGLRFFEALTGKEIAVPPSRRGMQNAIRFLEGDRTSLRAKLDRKKPAETTEQPEDESPLAVASRVVNGDRQRFYGHPLDNHGNTADLWRAWLSRRHGVDIPIVAEDVGILMILLKCSREANAQKADNMVDICGYAENVHMIRAERARRDREDSRQALAN